MPRESTAPFTFFLLVLPFGITSGFISITLPYILTHEGFSVAAAASMVALGVSANLCIRHPALSQSLRKPEGNLRRAEPCLPGIARR